MSRIEYQTFDVVIKPKDEDGMLYDVEAHGHGGKQSANPVKFHVDEVVLPENEDDRDQTNGGGGLRHLTLGDARVRRDYPLLWTGPPDAARARKFGGRLFRAVFKDSVLALFAECKTTARTEGTNLRIRLNLSDSPKLAVWPWEYLYNPDMKQFFAMFPQTPVVRYLPQQTSEGPLEVVAPLRILIIVSLPPDVATLDAAREIKNIRSAMKRLSKQNLLKIVVLKGNSIEGLSRKLDQAQHNGTPFHILHYIGHGLFDTVEHEGKLLLTQNGRLEAVDGEKIGTLLNRYKDHLRLVIINACEGARLSRIDSYAGVAQNILRTGEIPAALAMQFRITDKAAVTFAKLFYEGLANSKPLEDCLVEVRRLMYSSNQEEWATPVLYMHASDGNILQVQPPQETNISGGTRNARARLTPSTRHYDEVKEWLYKGQLVVFLGLNVNLYGRQLMPSWSPGSVLPGGVELFDYLKRTHHYPLAGGPLASIAQRLVVDRKSEDLYEAFASTFAARLALPALYSFLARVVKSVRKQLNKYPDPFRRRPLILTANYDNSVERAFEGQGIDSYHVISYSLTADPVGEFQHTRVEGTRITSVTSIGHHNKETVLTDYNPVIIKLPGAVEEGSQSYAVTEDHFFYLSRKDLLAMLPSQLVAALKSSRHLYLGYDVQDWPYRALLYAIWGDLKTKYKAWAVVPDVDDPNRAHWDKCDVKVIQAPLEDYVAGLEQYLFCAKRKRP